MFGRIMEIALQEELTCCRNLQTTSAQKVNPVFKVIIKSLFIKMI